MRLDALLEGSGATRCAGPDLEVRGVAGDSRRVEEGDLFLALRGTRDDGRRFVAEALARGAVAVAATRPPALPEGVAAVRLNDERVEAGRIAARFWGEPSKRLDVVAVTGTNGKTTTASLVRAVLEGRGGGCGMIGTVLNVIGDRRERSRMTTPPPEDLQRLLAEAVAAGLDACVLEASSHALDQRRLDAVDLDVAVYTNLGRDHLDYHGSLEAYGAAKARLLEILRPGGTLVLNEDDPFVRTLGARASADLRVLRYSATDRPGADLRLEVVEEGLQGTRFLLRMGEEVAEGRSPLFGLHNRADLLAAAAAGLALGLDLGAVGAGLGRFEGVPGRVERLALDLPFEVLVDYAHTPDAFAVVLPELRRLVPGRLILVFGCGGEKDRGKRSEMGALAERHADLAVLTADNPRAEPLDRIQADILSGFERPEAALKIDDRGEAVARALEAAEPGDLVLLAGKGHESEQVLGDRRLDWDDRRVAVDWARRRQGRNRWNEA